MAARALAPWRRRVSEDAMSSDAPLIVHEELRVVIALLRPVVGPDQ
jgi:hypothetical protein